MNRVDTAKIIEPVRNLQVGLMAGEVSHTKKFEPIRGETNDVRSTNLMEKQAEARKTPAQIANVKENTEEARRWVAKIERHRIAEDAKKTPADRLRQKRRTEDARREKRRPERGQYRNQRSRDGYWMPGRQPRYEHGGSKYEERHPYRSLRPRREE